jgi:hypothetical protein
MIKVALLGDWYINRFRNNSTGEEFIEEITRQEYENLRQPTKEGHTWVCSGRSNKFDTPTNKLREGEYANDPDGGYLVYDPTFWFTHADEI